jgi:hypothetical protein
MSTTYSVTKAANRLKLSTSTIRRFADTFVDYLPDYGKQQKGKRRELTESDLRHIFALVRMMENQPPGYGREDLLQALQEGQEQLVVPASLPRVENLAEAPVESPTASQEAPQPLATITPAQLEAFTDVLQRISVHLDKESAESKHLAPLDRLTAALEQDAAARKEEAEARKQQAATMDRMITALHAFIAAVVFILLITIAVAAGWIG